LKITKKILSEKQIQERIIKLASEINSDYEGKNLIILGVLKGAFIAISDLAKNLNIDVSFEFMSISSYEGSESTGQIKIEKDLDIDISGKNILIVEDIFDTGLTLSSLIDILESRNPESIEIMCMFVKSIEKKNQVKIKYKGFEIGAEFVVGYGLDYMGKYRELPYLAELS
tara:strand:+ start:1256 stop:1768 length:513 start_codon:yes stop_codon:yes gene_type:complete